MGGWEGLGESGGLRLGAVDEVFDGVGGFKGLRERTSLQPIPPVADGVIRAPGYRLRDETPDPARRGGGGGAQGGRGGWVGT